MEESSTGTAVKRQDHEALQTRLGQTQRKLQQAEQAAENYHRLYDHYKDLSMNLQAECNRRLETNGWYDSIFRGLQQGVTQAFVTVFGNRAPQHLTQNHMMTAYTNTQAQCEKLRDQLTREKNIQSGQTEHIKDLEVKIAKLEDAITERGNSIAAKEAELTKSLHEMAQDLQKLRMQEMTYNFKVSDSEIRNQYQEISFNIRQFVRAYFIPDASQECQGSKVPWKMLVPSASIYMSSELITPLVYESFMWMLLARFIFSGKSKACANDLGAKYERLCRQVRGGFLFRAFHSKHTLTRRVLTMVQCSRPGGS